MELASVCFRCHQPCYGDHCPHGEGPAPHPAAALTPAQVVQRLFDQARADHPAAPSAQQDSLRVIQWAVAPSCVLVRTLQPGVIDVFTVRAGQVVAYTQQPDAHPDQRLEDLLPT